MPVGWVNVNRKSQLWATWIASFLATGFAVAGPLHAVEVDDVQRANRRCMNCHGQQKIIGLSPEQRRAMVRPVEGQSDPTPGVREGLYVGPSTMAGSVHETVACVSCHADAAELPHAAKLPGVTCESCHTIAAGDHRRSVHAKAKANGDAAAPDCASCHGSHNILRASDRQAPTYPLNVVKLCGDCHAQHNAPTTSGHSSKQVVASYLDSVHGQAVTKGGLVVAATCVDCHNAHDVQPAEEPDSSVNRNHVAQTCGQCHIGVADTFSKSIHGRKLLAGDPNAPVCTQCHTAHAISHSGTMQFERDIVSECGECHNKPLGPTGRSLYDTYRLSYHGQVNSLGSDRGARCSDCHGAHDVLPVDDPASRLYVTNRADTCRRCHRDATENFAKFHPHADYRDGENFPVLHYVWLYFMVVISCTLAFFGMHSLLWFIRGGAARIKHGRPVHHARDGHSIQRFQRIDRVNHAFIIVTFFGLTLTGMPLLLSDQPWARLLAGIFGGVQMCGIWHRLFAIMLIGNFVVHFFGVINRCRKFGARQVIFGPNSMLPRWRDVTDMIAMFRWFFGGPKPTFDRWTYWEKFDYWAEIFGTSVIGFTGLMLWFPELFSNFLPGWMYNIATVVHGYEAMLAVAFIFTIHFFNAHLRVEKFPIDDVMFTGRLPEAEFIEERGAEYERLKASGELERYRVTPAPHWQRRIAFWAGIVAMTIGTIIVALIVMAGLKAL